MVKAAMAFSFCRHYVQRLRSDVPKQGHESEVHMGLIVAVEQRCARIVRNEIGFGRTITWHNHNIFFQTCKQLGIDARDFEGVPVQVKRVIVSTPIDHLQPVFLPLL
jgi:hypothetical protein